MLKPHSDPYGYKKLLAYKKAEELQSECSRFTHSFPFSKTLSSLQDQMDRSARIGKQNIVEGWKRNTTREYFNFLGFAIGAIAELEEDCNDIIRGNYPELKGIMGQKGKRGSHSDPVLSQSKNFQSSHSDPVLSHFSLFEVEKLRFYPLDSKLSLVVQLKLRCKELNFLLSKIQKSLELKMSDENTFSSGDRGKMIEKKKNENKKIEKKILEDFGFVRLENGKVVEK